MVCWLQKLKLRSSRILHIVRCSCHFLSQFLKELLSVDCYELGTELYYLILHFCYSQGGLWLEVVGFRLVELLLVLFKLSSANSETILLLKLFLGNLRCPKYFLSEVLLVFPFFLGVNLLNFRLVFVLLTIFINIFYNWFTFPQFL